MWDTEQGSPLHREYLGSRVQLIWRPSVLKPEVTGPGAEWSSLLTQEASAQTLDNRLSVLLPSIIEWSLDHSCRGENPEKDVVDFSTEQAGGGGLCSQPWLHITLEPGAQIATKLVTLAHSQHSELADAGFHCIGMTAHVQCPQSHGHGPKSLHCKYTARHNSHW